MKKIFLLSLVLGVLFTSCQQQTKTKSYDGYTQSSTGLYYNFYQQNEGENPQIMDVLDVMLSCSINDTAVLIPENRMILPMMESLFAGDIYEGFKMMHKGDSASFMVRADSTFITLFGSPMPNVFSIDDLMRFEIRLNDFCSESELYAKKEAQAEQELSEYLKNNNITPITTESGLNYVITKEGNGEKPSVGTLVTVHYTGKFLDGSVFDSSLERNNPIQFVLGIGQVIPGWDEGLQLLSKGSKAVLYIPYYLAYGDRGAGTIPPFSTLIFEVELIDF